jgi:chromosome segregation ATPase
MKIDGIDEVSYQLASIAHSLNSIAHGSGSHEMSLLILKRLQQMENNLMATFAEVEQELLAIKAQNEETANTLVKIKAETGALQNVIGGLTQGIVDLQAALADAQANSTIPESLLTAVDAVKTSAAAIAAKANEVDELVPDVPIV